MKRERRISGRRSKQNLIRLLQDPTTRLHKVKYCAYFMEKLGFMQTTWEYTLVMKKYTQVGDWNRAMEFYHNMKARGFEENRIVRTAAIVALSTGKRWQKALDILAECELHNEAPLKIGCLHSLRCCELGAKWEKAIELLDMMDEYGMEPGEDYYMPAVNACENAGEFEKSAELFRILRERTKLMRMDEEAKQTVVSDKAPKAPDAPWRLPGAIALDAFETPLDRIAARKERKLKQLAKDAASQSSTEKKAQDA